MRKKGRALSSALLETWDPIKPASLPEDERDTYERRELAIRQYAAGERLDAIEERTGIQKQEIYRFVERCLCLRSDGLQVGFKGLVPYRRLCPNKYFPDSTKQERTPKAGALSRLFQRYPSIENALLSAAIEGKREGEKLVERNMPVTVLHKYFLDLCEKAGIRGPHYPWSPDSDSEGMPALRRWIAKIRTEHSLAYHCANGQEIEANKSAPRGPKEAGTRRARSLYRAVELDGHKIDVPLRVSVPSPTGEGVVWRSLNRVWIIAAVARLIGVCLGYSYSLEVNYSGRDVVRAIQRSLLPWSPRPLAVEGVTYREGDGMPNGTPELTFVCWDELWLDNFMAHRSEHVLLQCVRMVKAIPVYSPVGAPDSHPWVEGFFNLLEESGIHRMPVTHGSGPKDLRRGKAEDLRYHLSMEQLEDLIDLLVCRINGSRAPGHTDQSRLDIAKHAALRRDAILWRVKKKEREEIGQWDMADECKVGQNHGVVVVRFAYGRYSSDRIKAAHALIGRTVLVLANSRRLRVIHVVLDDGTDLGDLDCEPRYRATEFSLETMREIRRRENMDPLLRNTDDIVRAYRKLIEREALKSARAARILARLQQEQADVRPSESDDNETQPEEGEGHDSMTYHISTVESCADDADEIAYERGLSELCGIRTLRR